MLPALAGIMPPLASWWFVGQSLVCMATFSGSFLTTSLSRCSRSFFCFGAVRPVLSCHRSYRRFPPPSFLSCRHVSRPLLTSSLRAFWGRGSLAESAYRRFKEGMPRHALRCAGFSRASQV